MLKYIMACILLVLCIRLFYMAYAQKRSKFEIVNIIIDSLLTWEDEESE